MKRRGRRLINSKKKITTQHIWALFLFHGHCLLTKQKKERKKKVIRSIDYLKKMNLYGMNGHGQLFIDVHNSMGESSVMNDLLFTPRNYFF
jgi:hypothetical protein